MHTVLKIKKIYKLKKQRIYRLLYIKTKLDKNIVDYCTKNKQLSISKRYAIYIKTVYSQYSNNKSKNTNLKNLVIKRIKIRNYCPFVGRAFTSKKYNMGRFMVQKLLFQGRLNNLRTY